MLSASLQLLCGGLKIKPWWSCVWIWWVGPDGSFFSGFAWWWSGSPWTGAVMEEPSGDIFRACMKQSVCQYELQVILVMLFFPVRLSNIGPTGLAMSESMKVERVLSTGTEEWMKCRTRMEQQRTVLIIHKKRCLQLPDCNFYNNSTGVQSQYFKSQMRSKLTRATSVSYWHLTSPKPPKNRHCSKCFIRSCPLEDLVARMHRFVATPTQLSCSGRCSQVYENAVQ